MKERKIRSYGWIATATLHLTFALLIAIDVSRKASTFLDPAFYAFCVPGLIVGYPLAMLFGTGGGHGEGVFFGILFGLPVNVLAYRYLPVWVIKIFHRFLSSGRQSRER